jgi:hypothetical protein
MAIFKRNALRQRDDQRTSAAELTLRASIYPLCLVTVLFFLWVSTINIYYWFILSNIPSHKGFLIRPHRHPQQALPRLPPHNKVALLRPSSRLLRRLSASFSGPCQLDPQTLWVQGVLYLGTMLVWCWQSDRMAVSVEEKFWGVLREYFYYWEWLGQFGNRS